MTARENAKPAAPGGEGGLQQDQSGDPIEILPTAVSESTQAATFDYSTFSEIIQTAARGAAVRIRVHLERVQEEIIEVGNELIAVKSALGHGHFGRWLSVELGMSDDMAERFMNVARRFPQIPHGAEFAPAVLYALSEKSTPPEVVEVAIDRARAGERLTRDDIKALKREHLPRDDDGKLAPEAKAFIRTVAKEIRADDQVVKRERRDERERELGERQRALPEVKAGIIVEDYEWDDEVYSRDTGMDRHASNHYPTSDTAHKPEEIVARRSIESIVDSKGCIYYQWTTVQHLAIALKVMELRGFEYKSHHVWGKDRISLGRWVRSKHELFLIGTRGSPPCPSPGTQWDSLILAPKGRHSAKPECFLEMIEQLFPTMVKVELNRRGPARSGWVAWGNEAEESNLEAATPTTWIEAAAAAVAEDRASLADGEDGGGQAVEAVIPAARPTPIKTRESSETKSVGRPHLVVQLATRFAALGVGEPDRRILINRIIPKLGNRKITSCRNNEPSYVKRGPGWRSDSARRRYSAAWSRMWVWGVQQGYIGEGAE